MAKTKKPEPKTEKIEREYLIPLREQCRKVPRYKKANKAIKTIKEFLVRHMKVRDRDLRKIKIDRYLNEAVWFRGIKKPPMKIKVKVVKEGENVNAYLAEMSDKFKFKKLREEKIEKKAQEIGKKKKAEKQTIEKAKTEPEKTTAPLGVPQNTELGGKEKKEEKEKKSAVVEAGEKIAKQKAKQTKHESGGKITQPKRQIRKALAK